MSGLGDAQAFLEKGDFAAAAVELRTTLGGPLDYLDQIRAAHILTALEKDAAISAKLALVRLAVLGSSTTAQLLPLLRLQCFKEGMRAEIYDAPYGTFQQEILNPSSELYAFKPQIALLFVNYRDALAGPAEAEISRWRGYWKLLRERASCSVIMNNFDSPAERPWGNLEGGRREQGLGRLRLLNASLAENAGEGCVILDQEHLSSVVGKEKWHDPRFWNYSRQAISFDGLPRYAAEAAAIIKALTGRSRRALVLDLDNTLWGGVVGDDGAAGIELGATPRGEAFLDFQRYLKSLRARGVILAVISKNDEAAATEPFRARSEMLLKRDDFAVFIANWKDKVSNMREVADKLHLGLDFLAFADDSPAERDLMRRFCPEVAVVDLPEDPSEFCRQLDSLRLFEAASVSAEDSLRAAHFKFEEERSRLREEAPNLDAFLEDLKMKAVAGPFVKSDVERIAQLINKTNQFNLTTRRYAEPEVGALIGKPGVWTLSVRLSDRLGDSGLVSVAILRRVKEDLEIDAWLMSCRVFGRTLEHFVFNRILELARAARVKNLIGAYLPTAKNGLVKELLPNFGFKPAKDGRWKIAVKDAKDVKTPIVGVATAKPRSGAGRK